MFSAVGAGNMHQMHIHETSLFMVLYDSTSRKVFDNYPRFNDLVVELSKRGQADLVRQGSPLSDIKHSLELDMRYGNQLVQTTVVVPKHSLEAVMDVMNILDQFSSDYGKRFGEGSQAPEAGIRINTIRVASYVEHDTVKFDHIKPIAQNKRSANHRPQQQPVNVILLVMVKLLRHRFGIRQIYLQEQKLMALD